MCLKKHRIDPGFPTVYVRKEGICRRFKPLLDATSLGGKIILDLGCGFGVYGKTASEMGPDRIIGFDLIKEYLIKAKGIERVQGNAYDLPFNDSTFDIVFLIEVLEHLIYPEIALQEIRRVSKYNSFLLVSVPNRFYPFETHGAHGFEVEMVSISGVGIPLLSWAPQFIRKHCERAHIFTIKNLIKLLSNAGFQTHRIDYMMPPMDSCDKLRNSKLMKSLRKIIQEVELLPLFNNLGVSLITVCSPKISNKTACMELQNNSAESISKSQV